MIYLLPREDTFAIFYNAELLPTTENEIIEIEKLPSGNGILRRNTNGEFYYDVFEKEEVSADPTVEEQILTESKYQTILLEMSIGL